MTSPAQSRLSRFSPEIILVCGCLCAIITFGPRSAVGLFQIPMSQEYGWSREVFSLAIAIQNLLWGVGQPFAGAVADRFGTVRVLMVGDAAVCRGPGRDGLRSDPGRDDAGYGRAGWLRPLGRSFNLVLGAFGKLLPESWRGMAFGAGTAAGSLGQFLFPPIGSMLIESFGWQQTALIFSGVLLLVIPLSVTLATRGTRSEPAKAEPAAIDPAGIGRGLPPPQLRTC